MLESYRTVLSVPGTARFSATGLVARLPLSMTGLGIVLLVAEVRDSYGLAGAVSAAYLLGNAVAAVPVGRIVDRVGQHRVLVVLPVAFTAGLTMLMVSVWSSWPLWTSFAWAALTGLALPPIGACVRARWSTVLRDPARVQTAFALEAVVDEVVFMLGPILVTFLATVVHPLAGLATGAGAGLVGTLLLAAQRRTEPGSRHQSAEGAVRAPMPWGPVLVLATVCLMLGSFFGSAEVATVAFAEEQGAKSAAGWLLALWALGSLAAGVVTGALTWRRGPTFRLRVGAVLLSLVMAPVAFVTAIPLMGVALFVAGFAIAPTLIAGMALAEQIAPPGRLTETMAVTSTGIMAGVAPGATLAGLAVDHAGADAAYLVAVGSGALAALLAQGLRDPD